MIDNFLNDQLNYYYGVDKDQDKLYFTQHLNSYCIII